MARSLTAPASFLVASHILSLTNNEQLFRQIVLDIGVDKDCWKGIHNCSFPFKDKSRYNEKKCWRLTDANPIHQEESDHHVHFAFRPVHIV